MRDFIYDFIRTFTGKFTIIMIVLIILITMALAYSSGSSISSTSGPAPASVAYLMPEIYQSGGHTYVSDFAVNGYGQPVSGLSVSSLLYNASVKTGQFNSTDSYFLNGTTKSYGFFNSSIPENWSSMGYRYSSEYAGGVNITTSYASYENDSKGSLFYPNINFNEVSNISFPAYLYIFPVANSSSTSHSNIFIYYASPAGAVMPAEKIYYEVEHGGFSFPKFNTSGMAYLKTISGIKSTVISLPLNKTAVNNYVTVELFNTSNDFNGGATAIFSKSVSAGVLLESSLTVPFEFLIPILGIFSAYFYYGKDKASGVLESIIARPVTKGRIFMSRFTAGSVSFFGAIIVAVAIADLIIFKYTGSWISDHTFFSIVLGYTAEAVAFSGIIYLASQYLKSQGAILGTGIGIFFIMVLFWGLIIDIILLETHVNLALKSTNVLYVALSAISPSFIPTLASSLNSGVYSGGFNGSSLLASSVGITAFSVIGVGLLWIIVPFVFSFLLARSRD
jgi:ABC-2 type transport system permease protein